jgi:hypothetical protein
MTINVGTQAPSRDLGTQWSREINRETANFGADYPGSSGTFFDAGGGARVMSRLWVGVSFSRVAMESDVEATGQIPHPFFFSQPRAVTGTVSAAHEETGVHVSVLYPLAPMGRIRVTLFGGPTFFTVKQDFVSEVRYTESFPYDSATFSNAPTKNVSKSAVGVNVGADVAYFFTPTIGAGALVRYAAASADMDLPVGGAVSVKAGGVQICGRLRVKF